MLLPTALSLSLTLGAAGFSDDWRREATSLVLSLLRSWDGLHEALDPHEEPSRPVEIRDVRPLSEQAGLMRRDLEARFLALGGRLLLISTPPVEIGDACLWQGVFAAWAAWDYRLSPTPARRLAAERAVEGLALLASKGRPIARSVLPASVETEIPGRWSSRDPDWQWKEDASVDSAAGWVFGCVAALELLPSKRGEILALLRRFADELLEGGYRLRNSDGSPTRFSGMGGSLVNSPPGLLSTLAVLGALSREEPASVYARERARLLAERQHEWAAYASGPALWRNMTTNHNIGHLALASALLTEDDPEVWAVYARGLIRLQGLTRKMGNSFWIYLSQWVLERRPGHWARFSSEPAFRAFSDGRARRRAQAFRAMLEWDYPACKRKRETLNSLRPDLKIVREPWGRVSAAQALPVAIRPPTDFVWQRSPFALDGWAGYEEGGRPQDYMPLDFLAAYALGRLTGGLLPGD